MARTGASFRHSYVVDSLCCVSRASIFTGQYPHQHRVLTNTANLPNPVGALGGWRAFRDNGNLRRSVNVNLHRAGYVTGFVGKYLNEYVPTQDGLSAGQPRGWSEFTAILRSAYDGWDFEYTTTDAGSLSLRRVPAPAPWATDVEKDRAYADRFAARRALGFIRRHASGEQALLPRGGDVRAARPGGAGGAGTAVTRCSRRRSATGRTGDGAPATAGRCGAGP